MPNSAPALTEQPETGKLHQIARVRMDVRRRKLTVTETTRITPNMLRIKLTSPELADFDSRGADDHIKLFFATAEGTEPCMRDYTPRDFDNVACTLTIDFALHEAGPATAWALAARPGDQLEIGGPRGSMIVPDDFDWYLLISDETGLPAVGRRLEELRADVPVISVVLVDSKAEVQVIDTSTNWSAHWLFRNELSGDGTEALMSLASGLTLPPGDGFIWIAGEAAMAKALRAHFVETRGHPLRWMCAAGYWRRGTIGVHERLD